MESSQKKESFIICLKALACLLITNSHCSKIYPISFLAVGGSFGNAIFFIVSGFCLAYIRIPFINWIKKRIMRLLPTVLLTISISILFIKKAEFIIATLPLEEIVRFYINKYWFVFAIILYYPIFYFIFFDRKSSKIKFLIIYFLGYAILYTFFLNIHIFSVELEGFAFFKIYFYFGIFILGGLLNIKKDKIYALLYGNNIKMLAFMTLSIISWLFIYGNILVFKKFYEIQFLIHVSVFCFTSTLMLWTIINSDNIDKLFNKNKICKCIINTLAESTLEIYLIQVTFVEYIEKFSFPINFILFLLCAFGGGIIYHYVISFLFDVGKNIIIMINK